MYLHAALLKITTGRYISYDDIHSELKAIGFEGNASTSSREVRVLVRRGLIEYIDYPNEKTAGTHRRFRKTRTKRLRK